ncbi:MAG: hypothetical protein K2Y08_07555 [Alphaproteobacteria bacterium]|nr:hypothetical protein [Alphaproteobacteria bacterium]
MIKNYLKGSKIFSLLLICAMGINTGPLSADNQCLDADSIRSAFKTDDEKFGWKYAAPLLYYSMKINSENYVRVINPDKISGTTTQSADGKCHHKYNFHGLLIGGCNLNKHELYKVLANKYDGTVIKTSQGKLIKMENLSPEMVILSEPQKSGEPELCSYNMSIVDASHEEL